MKRFIFSFMLLLLVLASCQEEDDKRPYETFELESPQLGLTKTIWLYLPSDYHTSEKNYPVIYFHDAQWLFELREGYTQEMHVDETLRALEADGFYGVIVVGIQSNELTRADEFSLYENTALFAGGKGAQYLDFVANTLKPKIDSSYRTKPDRANTAMMGASLGGLATVYALTEHPDVFGKAALFSAALHFNADTIFSKASKRQILSDVRLFSVVGKNEFNEQVNFPRDNETLVSILRRQLDPNSIHFQVHDDGEHKIWYWEREFPSAVIFLFN